MSGIIRQNPDILKYIYIDKLGGNVKVIISPDKTGITLDVDKASAEKPVKESSVDYLK
jgi:hypothetical protein